MYKWPQGRVIRTICLILTVVIAADLGYNGAYGRFAAHSLTPSTVQLIIGIVFTILALGGLVGGTISAGFYKRHVDFLIEVESEMQKVEWPKVDQVWKFTAIIAVVIVVLGMILALCDWLFVALITKWGLPVIAGWLGN